MEQLWGRKLKHFPPRGRLPKLARFEHWRFSIELAGHWQSHRPGISCGGHGHICWQVVCPTVIAVMADDIETIRRVGLQRAYTLIRDLEAYRGFARLTRSNARFGKSARGKGASVL